MNEPIKITKNNTEPAIEFSICTLVTDHEEYKLMRSSFETRGFDIACEYIIADNSNGNEFDAYQAISAFLKKAKGKFIVLVHQDVRAIDDRKKLLEALSELEAKDPSWAICGNAGSMGYHESAIYIQYESHKETTEGLPMQVRSLDENFLVIRSASNLTISADLKGFHLYGTDLCIIAKFLGYTSYVIPYMVMHLSKGNIKALKEYVPEFLEQYGRKTDLGYIQTTCTQFYLSNSSSKNKLLNSGLFFFIVKQFKRYPYLLRSLFKKTARVNREKHWDQN